MIIDDESIYWDKLIWNRMSISKHRMIIWLVMHQRLRTADKLVQLGVMDLNPYLLCAGGQESRYHLFFQCTYATQCLAMVKIWLKPSFVHKLLQRQNCFAQISRISGFRK